MLVVYITVNKNVELRIDYIRNKRLQEKKFSPVKSVNGKLIVKCVCRIE